MGGKGVEVNTVHAIIENIIQSLDVKNQVRDETLQRSRRLIRTCNLITRAIHRRAFDEARDLLAQAREQARELVAPLHDHPDLYYTGYTGDALKEWVEAEVLYAIIAGQPIPTPEALDVPGPSYLGGLAEAATELRRHILDLMRHQRLEEAEHLLNWMDEIYDALILVSYPDAITGNLRRQVDVLRGVLERTRGDLTLTLEHDRLRQAIVGANTSNTSPGNKTAKR